MSEKNGVFRNLTASGLIAVFVLSALLPLTSNTASANNMGAMNSGVLNSNWMWNPPDTWDFTETAGSYVSVMMKSMVDYDMRIRQNQAGGGIVLVSSNNAGTPDVCVYNGNGAAGNNQRSAEVYDPHGLGANWYYIEYRVSSTIAPNSIISGNFNANNNMLETYQVYLTAGVTYTFKFNSVSNLGADYRFYVYNLAGASWGNLGNADGSGGYSVATGYVSYQVSPAASDYYGVVVLAQNNFNSNWQFVVGAPDLTVSSVTLSPAPVVIGGINVIPQNRPYTYTVTVYNQGYGDADAFTITNYDNGVQNAVWDLAGLTGRTSTSNSFSYPTANPDTHYLSAQADSGGAVGEDGASGTAAAEGNNGNGRTDAVAEVKTAGTNDGDDTIPSAAGYGYYFYAYYLSAGETQKFSLWGAPAGTDLDMYLYGPTGTLVATAASAAYPERFTYSSSSGGYYYILVQRAAGVGSSFTFSVDDSPPAIQVVQPSDGSCIRGDVELRLNCQDSESGISTDNSPAYRVDGGSWTAMTQTAQAGYNYVSTLATAGLLDGTHTIDYMDWDNAANSASASETVTVDNTAPSACTLVSPVSGGFVDGYLDISVAAGDQIGLAKVELTFGGVLAGLGTQEAYHDLGTGYWDYRLDTSAFQDGVATVTPVAIDQAGNTLSGPQTSFTVDNLAPDLLFSAPADGSYVAGNAVAVNATASDAAGTVTVRYRVDGGAWHDLSLAGGVYSDAWDSTQVTDSSHTITVRATDGAGHISEQTASVMVDNGLPSCSIASPSAGQYIDGGFVFKVYAWDQNGIHSVTMTVPGAGTFTMAYNTVDDLYEAGVDTTLYPDAVYSLSVAVSDNGAFHGLRAPTQLDLPAPGFSIDNAPPTLTLGSPQNMALVEGVVTMDVTSSDAPAAPSVEFSIDGISWTAMASGANDAWTASWNSATVADGTHAVKFRAQGHLAHETDLAITVIVDNTAPVCAISAPADKQYIEGNYVFKVSATDAVGVADLALNITDASHALVATLRPRYDPLTQYYEAALDTSQFPDGVYQAAATAADAIGHKMTSPASEFRIDNHAPSLIVLSPQSDEYVSGPVVLNGSASDEFLAFTEYSVDGGAYSPLFPTVPGQWNSWNSTQASDGPHTFRFIAADAIGHIAMASLTVTVDNHAPRLYWGAPDTGSFISGIYTVKVKATDEVGIRSVTLAWDGTPHSMTFNAGTGYYEYLLDTASLNDGDWTLTATASELAGLNPDNVSARAVRIDNSYPVLHVLSPMQGEVVSGIYDPYLNASDTYLSAIEFKVDSLGWASVAGGWDTTRNPDGVHTVTFRATDMTGRSTEVTLTVTIDNSAPVCAFAAPTNNSYVDGTVLIQIRASDGAALSSVVLDGTGAQAPAYDSNNGLYESELDTQMLGDGTYSYTASSTDLAGRTTVSHLTLNIDNHAPELTVSYPDNGASLTGVLKISANATDAFPTVVEYQFDSLGWMAATSMLDTSLLSNGAHGLAIRATDAGGKVSIAQLLVKVDNSPPVVSILEPSASGVSIAGEFVLRVAVGENEGLSEIYYTIDNGTPLPLIQNRATGYYEQSIRTTAMADSAGHRVTVVARSQAGLVTNISRDFRVDNTAPSVTVRSPGGAAQKGVVKISVDVQDATGVSEVVVRIDGGSWRDMSVTKTAGRYEYSWSTAVPQNGEHTFEVRTTDTLGNRGTWVYGFKVDNPDYSLAILAAIIIGLILVVGLLVARGRKKRPEEFLPPEEPETAPRVPASKDFPEASPVEDDRPPAKAGGLLRFDTPLPPPPPPPQPDPTDAPATGPGSLQDRASEAEARAGDTSVK